MGVFTSAYKPLSHGALNWDTQLRTDMGMIENLFNGAIDQGGATDLNNYISQGVFKGYSFSNAPGGATDNFIVEIVATLDYQVVVQTAHKMTAGAYASYRRYYIATSGWTAWSQVLNWGDSTAAGNGVVTSGWAFNRFSMSRFGRVVSVDFSATRTGGTITGTTSGNISNITIGNVGSWRPSTPWAPMGAGPGGPTCSLSVEGSSGNLALCAMPPSYNLVNGQEITCGGSFITNF